MNVADILRLIERMFGENTPERHEATAFLFQRLAYASTRRAEQLRTLQRAGHGKPGREP